MKDTTKDATKDIARTDVAIPAPSPKEGEHHPRPDTLEVGHWYWVRHEKRDKEETAWTFCCLVHLGSNFAKLESPPRGEYKRVDHFRVHFENFFDDLIWVPNAQEVIDGYLSHHHSNLHMLMREMKEVTARLAIAPSRELHAADTETQALSTTLSGQSYGDYKGALVKARDKDLPAIFKAIKAEHAELAKWMSAQIVPMEAEANKLSTITASIRSRIFNVELYAGLVEVIEQVKEGEPADLTTPITLLQRRHYMDEECLAHYEIGGMQFRHIRAFDRWIAREDNMSRLLPFPRCILAFRVRRYNIEREVNGLSDFFQLMQEQKEDRRTFLYIRNGGQLFRMSTGIDFGEHLFPDIARETLGGVKLWAKHSDGHVEDLITDHDYQERVKAWKERVARNEENRKKWEADKAAWEKTADKKEREKNGHTWNWFHEDTGLYFDEERFQPFDKTSVYYDDIKKYVQDQIDAHNRIALVLQGLLDRSPVLHPHPPWQLWTEEGASQALRLIHDDSRALTPGEAPDFEAYRAKLNASIKPGSVTIGQHDAWREAEVEKWNEKNPDRDRRWRYTPHENPGPGRLATVVKKRGDRVFYEWTRKSSRGKKRWVPNPNRPGWGHHERDYADITSSFSCPTSEVFNVSAYEMGDFKQFFSDPRTRADYVKWAPHLLTAEEWHAGNPDGKPREKPWTCDGCKKLNDDYSKPCSCGVKRWWRDSGGIIEHAGHWSQNEKGRPFRDWSQPYDVVEEASPKEGKLKSIEPKLEDEDDEESVDKSVDEESVKESVDEGSVDEGSVDEDELDEESDDYENEEA